MSLHWNPGLHSLSCSLVVLPVYLHANVGPPAPPAAASPTLALQLRPCCESWLPVSAPPSGLDECFFFNSLVVGLPYSSIFWQFWLFFVFKFVVVLLLVVRGGTVYLPMPPSWPEVSKIRTQYFSFMDHAFGVIPKNSLPDPSHTDFLREVLHMHSLH